MLYLARNLSDFKIGTLINLLYIALYIMRQLLLLVMLVIGSVASFAGYCAILIDWTRDLSSGVYADNKVEAVLETGALLLYTYMAIRFMKSKMNA